MCKIGGFNVTRCRALASLVFVALLSSAVHYWLGTVTPTASGRRLLPASIQSHAVPTASPAPSLAAFQQLQANPALLSRNTTFFTAEFEAAPWLLPPRTPALSWAGVHGLDELMALRSQPVGGHDKAVFIMLFSKSVAVMAQNSIYSLVKFGGVNNYVAATCTHADLEACADLNLPCADVSRFLARPVENPGGKTGFYERDWLSILWIKPTLLVHVLEQGYVVMMADVDIAYTMKPVWQSYLAFMEQAAVDGTFQIEDPGPVNGGFYVMLPTPAALSFAKKWASLAPEMLEKGAHEQDALTTMQAGISDDFLTCLSLCQCYQAHRTLSRQKRSSQVPVFRKFQPSYFHYTQTECSIGHPDWTQRIDPCDWQVVFVHAICNDALPSSKESILRALGFWFVDNEQGCAPMEGSHSNVPACRPLQWRLPQTEAPHYSCASPGSLGLVHGTEPAAAAALRAGVSAEDEARLLDSSKNDKAVPDWC